MKSMQKKQRTELKRRRRANACKKITNISKTLRNIKKAEIVREMNKALVQQAVLPVVAEPVDSGLELNQTTEPANG